MSKRKSQPCGYGQPPGKKSRFDKASTNGIIKKIKVQNFMCHSELCWEPGVHINFVIGANGSGKSSILQALVLGLLADAKHTKRYDKMPDFIKKGANKAVIEITLNNDGDEGFKPEVYGESIIFERTIFANGCSQFMIKDFMGNVKEKNSKKAKQEGKNALDFFQIQVNNPVIILQQDEAKQMLQVESPDKLYEFFQRATLLKQVVDEYKAADFTIQTTEANYGKMKQAVKNQQKIFQDAQAKYKQAQSKRNLDVKEKEYMDEYAWALEEELHRKLQNIDNSVENKRKEVQQKTETLKKLHEEKNSIVYQVTAEEAKLEEEKQEHNQQEEVLQTIEQNMKACQFAVSQLYGVIKNENKLKNDAKTEIRILEDQVKAILGKTVAEREEEERSKKSRINNLNETIAKHEEEIKQTTESRSALMAEKQEYNEAMEENKLKARVMQDAIKRIDNEIKDTQSLGKGSKAVYGRKHCLVDVEIKKNRFERKPFGPVGHFIKLKGSAIENPKVKELVETVLSGGLTNYICHCDQDRRTLLKIFNKVFDRNEPKPKIFASKYLDHRHNVDRAHVDLTLMDLLDVEEVPVFNYLVDQHSIESVALVERQDEAKKITTHLNNVPRHLKHVYTLDFYKFMPPTQVSSYRTTYVDPRSRGLLSGDTTEKLKSLRVEKNNELQELEGTSREYQTMISQIEAKKDRVFQIILGLRAKVAESKKELTSIENEKCSETSQNLLEKMETKKEELLIVQKRIEASQAEKEKRELQLKQFKLARDEKAVELSHFKDKLSPLENQLQKLLNSKLQKSKEVTNFEKVCSQVTNSLQVLERKRKTALEEHKNAKQRAETRTNNVQITPSMSKEKLNAKINNIRNKRRESDPSYNDLVSIEEEYKRKMEEYTKVRDSEQALKKQIEELKRLHSDRQQMFLAVRTIIRKIVIRRFNVMTESLVNYIDSRIYLRINPKQKTVAFKFESPDGKLSSMRVSSLSGGEKSFAQMAFICSLWEVMNPPIRCLDEWDVFLDPVNRKKISTHLLKFGLSKPDYQFIFISPQGATDTKGLSLEEKNQVEILEVKKS